MDNCFVCDAYFYPIKNIPSGNGSSGGESDSGASSILDPSKVARFCESMDLSPIPKNVKSEHDVVPLCHKCTIASCKILLIQEQISHLQNQVSQLQYSIAETALVTYYNNKPEGEDGGSEEDDQADPDSAIMNRVRNLLRDRWEEQNEKSENVGSVESHTSNKDEGNEDSNSINENSLSHSSERDEAGEGKTPATKRPASFEWSQNLKKKNQMEGLEPNILYVNLGEQENRMDEQEDAISFEESQEHGEYGSGWDNADMNSNEHFETFEDDGDDVVVEENLAPKIFQPINYINMAHSSSAPSSFIPEMPSLTSAEDYTISPASSIRPVLKTYSRSTGSSSVCNSTDKKIRVCPFDGCGKEFTNVDRFAEHINVHNGNGPSCDVCQKVFPRKYNLRIHMRTHTGEKPHKCPICLQKYADKSNLNAHIRKHYEKPFHCSICRRMFDDISSAQTHITTFHPERKERNLIRLTRLIPKVPT